MKYAEDDLLATDRAVRAILQVRDGQTIAQRAAEIELLGGMDVELAHAYLNAVDHWRGMLLVVELSERVAA